MIDSLLVYEKDANYLLHESLGIGFIHIGSSPKSDRYRISMRDTSISNSFTRGSSKEKSGWEGRSLARGVLSSHLLIFLFSFSFSSTGRDSSFIVAAWLAQGFEEGSVFSFSFLLGP